MGHPTETGDYWCKRHDTDGWEPVRVDDRYGELRVVPLQSADAEINDVETFTDTWVLEWGPQINHPK